MGREKRQSGRMLDGNALTRMKMIAKGKSKPEDFEKR